MDLPPDAPERRAEGPVSAAGRRAHALPGRGGRRNPIAAPFAGAARLAVALVVAASTAAAATGCGRESGGPPPLRDVVLLTVDTLRADRVGFGGSKRDTTPFLDSLAREGAVFERAQAPIGHTLPSLATLHSSTPVEEHGIVQNQGSLAGEALTLAETLVDSGFRAAAWMCHPWIKPERGLSQGFERYEMRPDERKAVEEAASWWETVGRDPARPRRFLWVHLINPHKPYTPPPPYDRMFDPDYAGPYRGTSEDLDGVTLGTLPLEERDREHFLALYDGQVRCVDDLARALLGRILAEDTLLVCTADHGEDLLDHHRYFFHSNSVYDSTLAIPLFFRAGGGSVPRGARFRTVVPNLDLAPTIAALAGVGRPREWRGRDLSSDGWRAAGEGGPGNGEGGVPGAVEDSYSVGQWRRDLFTIRTPRWRYIWNPKGVTPDDPPEGCLYPIAEEELYDLAADPRESRNRAAGDPEVARALRGRLRAHLEALPVRAAGGPGEAAPMDPDEAKLLRELGYGG